ncbi:MAG: ABC transporter permease [Candidatus Omnitrophica bacterium]|nr:ABC transporter permease [Candidatus Omnitrophota bacterium]
MTPQPGLLGPAYALCHREVIRFFRQRSRIIGALGTPLLFWILIGSGLGNSFKDSAQSSMSYLEYFYPGTLVLILLFSAIFATFSIIEDRHAGFLQGVLAAPVPRMSIVLGKILGGATLAFIQAVLFLVFAPTIGISVHPVGWAILLPVLYLIAMSLVAMGFFFAWSLDSTQGYHAIMNMVMIPMWLLSGAFFPQEGAFVWVRWIMAINPLTYGVAAVRHCLYWGEPMPTSLPGLPLSLAGITLFGTILFVLSSWKIRSTTARDLG